MFSKSSKYAIYALRPYIAPLPARRLLSTSRANFSSAAEDDSFASLQEDETKSAPDSKPTITKHQSEDRRNRRTQRILDVDALGQPGKILVLPLSKRRQPKVAHQDRKKSKESSAEKKTSLPVDSFIQEITPGSGDDYISLLDEIRSSISSGDILSSEEWVKLQVKIERSFTLNQLSNYVAQYSHRTPPLSPISDESTADAEVDASGESETWQPGEFFEAMTGEGDTATSNVYQAPKSVNSEKKTKLTKEVLAERILRECWQLEVQDAIGKLDIRLPSQVIFMLLSSDQYSLEELAHSHDAKIEPFGSLNLIRVYGTRRACESVQEIVKTYCTGIRTESIDLSFLDTLRADESTLKEFSEWLAKTYGVYIPDLDRNPIASVSYFAGSEHMFNRARQELELASSILSVKPVSFSSYVPSDATGLLKSISSKRSEVLSLLYRSKSWTRWSIPTSLEDYTKESLPPLFSEHKPTFSSEILQVLRERASRTNPNDVEERLTAAIGQCLYQSSSGDNATHLSAAQLGDSGMPRLWHGWLPKMLSFIGTLQRFPGTKEGSRHHQFRMLPCNQNDRTLPALEVDLTLSWERNSKGSASLAKVSLNNVRAIVEETSIDYLLPESNYDLRFTRTLTREIFKVSEDGDSDMLREILLSSLDEPLHQRGKPFPPTCQVPLPGSLLRDIQPNGNKYAFDSDKLESDTIIGQYWLPSIRSFSGTMIQSFDFLGEKLNYNHINGGPLGVRKDDQVSLEMLVDRMPLSPSTAGRKLSNAESDSADAILEQEFRSFYRTACQLAFALTKHSSRRQA